MERCKKRCKNVFLLLLCLILASGLCACEKKGKEEKKSSEFYLYYEGSNERGLKPLAYEPKTSKDHPKELARELLSKLATRPTDSDYTNTIPDKVSIEIKSIKDGLLTINCSSGYYSLETVNEIILRSSVVLTMTQLSFVDQVVFTIDGESLIFDGEEVGAMKKSDFVDNTQDHEISFENRTIHLYFCVPGSDQLRVYQYNHVLSSNVSLEQYVMNQLIAGPKDSNYSPVLSSKVKLNSVYRENGICYVDFTESFEETYVNCSNRVVIEAIVNSLCSLSGVEKVQFLINGQSDVTYHKEVSLKDPFYPTEVKE